MGFRKQWRLLSWLNPFFRKTFLDSPSRALVPLLVNPLYHRRHLVLMNRPRSGAVLLLISRKSVRNITTFRNDHGRFPEFLWSWRWQSGSCLIHCQWSSCDDDIEISALCGACPRESHKKPSRESRSPAYRRMQSLRLLSRWSSKCRQNVTWNWVLAEGPLLHTASPC
jgi:hypothetical protein